ncbi:MAG: DNA-3-methyladenine glycosylase family protein [Ezakiella coagulans]|uniref:DNA-3-methyladenine glycosylase family protein n=1 Tax=Ezakiella coagulans TaxID=46507 RepID=UPI00399B2485
MYFKYGEKEISYLKNKDKKLAEVIEKVGLIERETDPEIFSALVHHIVGQQISTKAQATIWERMKNSLGAVTPETILNASVDEIRSFGISLRKVEYIKDFAEKVHTGEFDIEAAEKMEDDELIKYLTTLKGVGVWTAEMILLFCLQRPNVFSFYDLAIQRGLRMVYHHRKIDRKLFEKYKRRFTPYCSVASLYLWAVSNGAIPEMRDYAPKNKR